MSSFGEFVVMLCSVVIGATFVVGLSAGFASNRTQEDWCGFYCQEHNMEAEFMSEGCYCKDPKENTLKAVGPYVDQ